MIDTGNCDNTINIFRAGRQALSIRREGRSSYFAGWPCKVVNVFLVLVFQTLTVAS
jgi:hypothetical protein